MRNWCTSRRSIEASECGATTANSRRFGVARTARHAGSADPVEVDGYLRQGTKAFLAGEHAIARGVFEALLPPIAHGEIDLGQHEIVDEVLTVNEHECAARYVVSVYLTTPLEGRAEALCRAIEAVRGLGLFWSPLEEMERVATGPLPALGAFLPLWVEHTEREPSSVTDWENDRGPLAARGGAAARGRHRSCADRTGDEETVRLGGVVPGADGQGGMGRSPPSFRRGGRTCQ